jgi:hypothetical protein
MRFLRRLKRFFAYGVLAVLLLFTVTASAGVPYSGQLRVRNLTRPVEFEYAAWMVSALLDKARFAAVDAVRYLDYDGQRQVVFAYLRLVSEMEQVQRSITAIYSDPTVQNPEQEAAALLDYQAELEELMDRWGPLAEGVIQSQVREVLDDFGLSVAGQPIPPPLYKVTPLPLALIVSPREVIRQEADISLLPDLSLDEIVALEQRVEQQLNVSALVVPVGGIGVYPTMVQRSTNLPWLVETVAHEWTHNYLTLRPLGMLYYRSGALRTMNETAANIAGDEVSLEVLRRYYPEFVPAEPEPEPPPEEEEPEPPAFDFQAEMHETRVTTDRLLAEGRVEEAEAYMEARRVFFLEHGYQIRRLNQAYFAFYGAYADTPTGAFGEDPVGPRVRQLREASPSLASFLNTIAWMTSFEDLVAAVGG